MELQKMVSFKSVGFGFLSITVVLIISFLHYLEIKRVLHNRKIIWLIMNYTCIYIHFNIYLQIWIMRKSRIMMWINKVEKTESIIVTIIQIILCHKIFVDYLRNSVYFVYYKIHSMSMNSMLWLERVLIFFKYLSVYIVLSLMSLASFLLANHHHVSVCNNSHFVIFYEVITFDMMPTIMWYVLGDFTSSNVLTHLEIVENIQNSVRINQNWFYPF